MAIINQDITVTSTITVRRATTIADAVRMDPESDYWSVNLTDGALRDAVITNRIYGAAGIPLREAMMMERCTRKSNSRRFWQEGGMR